MTRHRDIERVLEHWFVDGVDQMPDRTYRTILDRVERQPQQRAWRLTRRDSHMSAYLKPLAAIAAVIVVAVAGFAILGRPSGPGVAPSASASPVPSMTTAPSASPSANPVFPSWFTPEDDTAAAGILAAGSHSTTAFEPPFSYTVPDGWVNSHDDDGYFGLFPDTLENAVQFGNSKRLANDVFMGPVPNGGPYYLCEEWEENDGDTATEIVAAIEASDVLSTSDSVEVSIGGLTGHQVDVRLDPAWRERCPGDPQTPTTDLADRRFRTILLDTPDGVPIVIFILSLHSSGHEAFLAETMPIIESFQFDLDP